MDIENQIAFLRTKDYRFIKEIGQGGTGRTILIKDEVINEEFICKKYSPFYEDNKTTYFEYFKNEIKILHRIYHLNIVRVFNYYLYPNQTTGYILMEYIEGKSIDKYIIENPDKIDDVFRQVVDGFKYLEENKILHRDIRPENLLVSESGIVKIIDFGFGKQLNFNSNDKSISLNWRYNPPKEFDIEIYDSITDIYFVGKLFEEILTKIENIEFKYSPIVAKMIIPNHSKRIKSFFDIYREIIVHKSFSLEFDQLQKSIYLQFSENLKSIISKIESNAEYNSQVDLIIRRLEELYQNSILENVLQNNNKLTRIFLTGTYNYYKSKEFRVELLFSFITLLKSVSENRRKVIMNNLWEKFDSIPRYIEPERDDLPF